MQKKLLLVVGLITIAACGPITDSKDGRDLPADSEVRRELPTPDPIQRNSRADWRIRDDLPVGDPGFIPNALCADLYAATFHPNRNYSESILEAFKHDTALDIMGHRYYMADNLPECLAETQRVLEPYLGRDAVEVGAFPTVAALAAPPSFDEYRAEPYSGAVVTPTADAFPTGYEQFLPTLVQSIAAGPNFGGRYFILEVSCGEACNSALIYDMRSGSMRSYPFDLGRNARFVFQRDSRLLGAIWDEGSEEQPYCGVRYIEISGSISAGVRNARIPGRCPPPA